MALCKNYYYCVCVCVQSGVVQGIMHLLLLSMSAHLTKQLGMAPGGEFRRAFHEVLIDDRLYSAILHSLEQTHCARM